MIKQGIVIDSIDDRDLTALQYAMKEQHALVAKLLVDHGAFLYPPRDNLTTSLEIALNDLDFKKLVKKLEKPVNLYE